MKSLFPAALVSLAAAAPVAEAQCGPNGCAVPIGHYQYQPRAALFPALRGFVNPAPQYLYQFAPADVPQTMTGETVPAAAVAARPKTITWAEAYRLVAVHRQYLYVAVKTPDPEAGLSRYVPHYLCDDAPESVKPGVYFCGYDVTNQRPYMRVTDGDTDRMPKTAAAVPTPLPAKDPYAVLVDWLSETKPTREMDAAYLVVGAGPSPPPYRTTANVPTGFAGLKNGLYRCWYAGGPVMEPVPTPVASVDHVLGDATGFLRDPYPAQQSCPNGQCGIQQVAPTARLRFFRR